MIRGWRNRCIGVLGRFILALVLVSASVTFTGCKGPVGRAIDTLDYAIEALEDESANWRQLLEETMDKLIEEGQETIRRDVDSVLQRGIEAAGTNIHCILDHLHSYVREDLIRIRAELLHKPVPPLIPHLCGADPEIINYDWVKDGSQTDMVFSGYNFDPNDPPRLYVMNEPDSPVIDRIRRPAIESIGRGPTDYLTMTVASPYSQTLSIDEPLTLMRERVNAFEEVDAGYAAVGTPYMMTADLTDVPLTENSEYLDLEFSNGERWSYNIKHPRQAEPPPATFTAGSIEFYNYRGLAQGQTNTGIPAADYDCGIVGLWADDGDIDENDREDILIARAFTEAGTWRIDVNFNTEGGENETWQRVVLMCLRTEYRETGYRLLKDVTVGGHSEALGLPTDQYYCGVVGMAARNGDIEEDGVQSEILVAYVEDDGGKWTVKAQFATQSGQDERWVVDVLCVVRDEELFHWERISGLDDKRAFETALSYWDYACGIVGMQARNGDINEKDSGEILRVFARHGPGDHWFLHTNFRTHNNAEDWTVDLLCARSTIATYSEVPWSQ